MRTFIGLLSLVPLLTAGSAQADTIYRYTGDYFTDVTGDYTTHDRVRGIVRIADDFTPLVTSVNSRDYTAGILAFRFTDGHQTLTQRNATVNFDVVHPFALMPLFYLDIHALATEGWIRSYAAGPRVDVGVSDAGWGSNNDINGLSHRGIWTVSNHETTHQVPEASSLVLMLSGLSGVGAFIWRFRR